MADSNDGLTLEGLAQILRDHMDGTAVQFAEVRAQFAEVGARLDAVGARIDNLRGEIGIVATIVRDLAQIVAGHADQIEEQRRQIDEQRRQAEEHRQYIRQVFSRMEQHDARFEAMTHDIRRILDAMERRGGDGGGRRR